ncbi:MAG: hypothetical protein IH845_01280 [Nanoarchaeota archaeon]|nr:hypothetical protein [Nanoarchaeota archaeon]
MTYISKREGDEIDRRFSQLVIRSNPEMVDLVLNRETTNAMAFLDVLGEEYQSSDFDLTDIRDLNAYASVPGPDPYEAGGVKRVVRWGPSHLDFLVDRGYLEYDPDSKKYSITPEGVVQFERRDMDKRN